MHGMCVDMQHSVLTRNTPQCPEQSLQGHSTASPGGISSGSRVNPWAQLGVEKAGQGRKDACAAAVCPL